jgi:putative DNA primase/helicase
LAWAVRGCLDWQNHGLGEPGDVSAATTQYRAEEDRLGAYLTEYCFIAREANVRARDLYAAYRKHAEEAREEVITQTAFGAAMTERGVERYTSNGTRYRGIGLLAEGAVKQ